MFRSLLSRALPALVGVVLLVSAGCGPGKGTPVSGKVVPPAGVKLADEDQIEINFVPDDPKVKRGAGGTAKPPGLTFTVAMSEGPGMLPGKYKVTVRITPYAGSPGFQERKQRLDDLLNKKFGEVGTTPLSFEVPASKDPVTVTIDLRDVNKASVTKD